MAKKVVKKEPAAEEETVGDADRQASEAEEEPTESVETTEAEAEAPEKEVKTPAEAEGELSEAELVAKMTPDQAKAFQKQRLEIKRLKEEMAKKERAASAFEALTPKAPGQAMPQMPKVESFMDAEGRIDMAGYQGAVQKYNESLAYRSQIGQSQIKQEMDQSLMRMKYPQLDPNSDEFDPALEKRAGDRYGRMLLESLYQGRPEPSIMDVATEVMKESGVSPKEKEKISKETLEKVSEKEQAASTAEAPSTAPRAKEAKMVSSFDELRQKTKEGDDDALAARIRAAEASKK